MNHRIAVSILTSFPNFGERFSPTKLLPPLPARGLEDEPRIFQTPRSNEEAFAPSQIKATRRVPQVRRWNLGPGVAFLFLPFHVDRHQLRRSSPVKSPTAPPPISRVFHQ